MIQKKKKEKEKKTKMRRYYEIVGLSQVQNAKALDDEKPKGRRRCKIVQTSTAEPQSFPRAAWAMKKKWEKEGYFERGNDVAEAHYSLLDALNLWIINTLTHLALSKMIAALVIKKGTRLNVKALMTNTGH